MQSLLGFEGAAVEVYFGRFGNMLKSSGEFSFQNRNKRPPKDPVNSVLSYKLSYRRILEMQARLLARVLSGEIKEYPAFVTR